MMCFVRTLSRALFACLCIFTFTSALRSQTNTTPWPNNPPVGIGTVGSGTPQNALQIHHNSAIPATMPAILRLSDGVTDSINIFGALALMPDASPAFYDTWSYLATHRDLVLHENIGDLILADLDPQPAAIRMSTTPDPTTLPVGGPPFVPPAYADIERVTIMSNGNVGIDLPPSLSSGLDSAADQLQIGGGSIPPSGYTSPIPGLTIYGGNRFEGMPKLGGGFFPVDWRGIYYNHYEDHTTGITRRFSSIGSCGISFADVNGGLMQLTCWPPDTAHPLTDSLGSIALSLTGNTGLEFWSDERKTGGSQYHHLFNVWRPGYGGSNNLRNVNGLFLHFTPVLIDTNADATDFTNLAHVFPRLGDGKTWMLAVKGPALFQEAYVSTDWPDFVFDPQYQLQPLSEVDSYIKANHHLPGVPSASEMAKTGVPLGATEATMMQKIEELTKYAIEQDKKIEKLEADVQELKNQKEK